MDFPTNKHDLAQKQKSAARYIPKCPVCLDLLTKKNKQVLPCHPTHILCTKCVLALQDYDYHCPLCRGHMPGTLWQAIKTGYYARGFSILETYIKFAVSAPFTPFFTNLCKTRDETFCIATNRVCDVIGPIPLTLLIGGVYVASRLAIPMYKEISAELTQRRAAQIKK